ncbi:MAG TPA: GNAT family N-acetyltransferase [Thermoanaerobaculia bacterium]|nr:GNAT family N-acetyltransferase [Thermoanaerobaculia bacterium]
MTKPSCAIEVITSARGLAELEPVWNGLLSASGVEHPFLSHEWITTWWECFGSGAELSILVARSGGTPVAVAPLMRTRQRVLGRQLQCIQFLANDHSPRCDFLIGSQASEVYETIFSFLMSGGTPWDVVALREVPAGSPTLERMTSFAAQSNVLAGWRHSYNSPFLPLAGQWEDALPSKRRWFLRNRLKRLSSHGPVELETVSAPSQVLSALEDGFRLEAAAWKGDAGTAMASDPAVRRFYTEFAMRAAARGWLRLQFLKAGGKRVAFAYALAYRQRMYLLKPGFDPEYAAYSPGNLLTWLVLQDASASGFESYDFLGRDDHWKRQWAEQTLAHSWIFAYADRPWARAAHYAKFELIPVLQKFPLYSRLRDSVLHLRATP